MPISDPVPRTPLHRRRITLDGYRRADGLFDIEAEITDCKCYEINVEGRTAGPDAPLHHMRLRITVDEGLLIHAAEAATEAGPYLACGGGAASFAGLVGLTVRPGFVREAMVRLGGPAGCTHIRELVQQLGTVAHQTLFGQRSRPPNDAAIAARMIDSCHAYAADGPVVRRRWPQLYTGPDRVAAD